MTTKYEKAKNKLKKAGVIAGISALSLVPLKGKAQEAKTQKDAARVEISVNLDELRNNISVLERDSVNFATLEKNGTLIRSSMDVMKSTMELFDQLKEMESYLLEIAKKTNDLELIRQLEAISKKKKALLDFSIALRESILASAESGIATAASSGNSLEEVTGNLTQKRALLSVAERQSK